LYRRLLALLPEGFCVWKEEPLTFVDSEPEPDISVTRGQENDYLESHPRSAELVIEVAVSSPVLDRANAKLYAEAGIKEYWIVLALEKRVDIYRKPLQGAHQESFVCGRDETIECAELRQVRVRIGEVFE
jgi:Uma2 family endonuclease